VDLRQLVRRVLALVLPRYWVALKLLLMKLWPANFPDKRQVLKCAQADVLYDKINEIS
jgi:hypothetical protein